MDNNSNEENMEQFEEGRLRHDVEQRLRAELAASYPRLRRRWKVQVGAALAVAMLAVTAVSDAAMPTPEYSCLHGSNVRTPQLAINDINATLKAL